MRTQISSVTTAGRSPHTNQTLYPFCAKNTGRVFSFTVPKLHAAYNCGNRAASYVQKRTRYPPCSFKLAFDLRSSGTNGPLWLSCCLWTSMPRIIGSRAFARLSKEHGVPRQSYLEEPKASISCGKIRAIVGALVTDLVSAWDFGVCFRLLAQPILDSVDFHAPAPGGLYYTRDNIIQSRCAANFFFFRMCRLC